MSKREMLNSPGVVKISGLDQSNQRFWQTTELSQVTRNKIRIHAVPGWCRLGDVLTVSYDKKTAEYRVALITDNDEVELVLLPNAECIFPHHLLSVDPPREPLPTPEPPKITVLPFKNETLSIEKRRFARTILRTHVIVTNRSTQYACQGTTADVSPGGCYVELPSPMSVGTEVEVSGGDRCPFRALGKVVTSHPMFGMGIAFDEQHSDIEQQLSSVTPNQATQPTATPAQQTCEPAPRSQPERLLSELMMWFAANPDLTRTKFFELVHNCSRDK